MTMDESKGTGKDASPGKSGQPPGSKGGTPKGKLYTNAEISKIKSDSAAMSDGRKAKVAEEARDTLREELQRNQSRLDALERERDESRLAEARAGGDKELLLYNREEVVKKRERQVEETVGDVTRREGQIKTDRAEVAKDRGIVSINVLAAKHGLEPEDLESLGISDPEALERVAERLAGTKPKGKGGEEEGESGEGEPFVPDTGETTGSGEPTHEQLEKMTMDQYAAYAKKRDTKP